MLKGLKLVSPPASLVPLEGKLIEEAKPNTGARAELTRIKGREMRKQSPNTGARTNNTLHT